MTPREEEPQIDVTMANVFVPFPGASAADVEQLVAIPAEQVLSQIPGLEHVWSVSRPGQAMITVQYKVGVPRNEAIVRLHDAILRTGTGCRRSSRRRAAGQAEGHRRRPDRGGDAVDAGPARGAFDLERVAHAVETELKRVPGTREVTTIGGPGRALQVLLDLDKLTRSGLSAADISQRDPVRRIRPCRPATWFAATRRSSSRPASSSPPRTT